jgi:hypothetical protein
VAVEWYETQQKPLPNRLLVPHPDVELPPGWVPPFGSLRNVA